MTKKSYGLFLAVGIAFIAITLEHFFNGSKMLYALIIGMSLNPLVLRKPIMNEGINFCAKPLLRLGVALLGIRISFANFQELGVASILWLFTGVIVTILFGVFLSKKIGFSKELGVLTGGAVGICGASAAMAISSVLPQNKDIKEMTIFTVVSVTTLSTIAMITHPLLVELLGLSVIDTAFILGGSIHDVAQVVGAGGMISDEVQSLSTMVKLTRVAILVPIVIFISVALNRENNKENHFISLVPIFLIGFILLVVANSLGFIPDTVRDILKQLSKYLLVVAVSALGAKTSLQDFLKIGLKPFLLVFFETLFILVVMLIGVWLL